MGHTLGPWRAGSVPSIGGVCREITAVGRLIAYVACTWDENIGDVITSEDDANVHLIAAAPELLAALKLLRDPDGDGQWPCYCDDPHFEGGMCENCVATAAIAKAEGRSA